MKTEESFEGFDAPEDDHRSRAELLAIIQRQERELAILASMVAARNSATVVTEQVPANTRHYEEPNSKQQIASYWSLSRQLASLGRTDTKRVLRRFRLLK